MKKSVVDRANKIVSKAANKYEPANDVYYVVRGTDEDRMDEHGSLENYCQNCIDAAVLDKKREFFLERMAEMGKIYEYEQSGFYRQPQYKWSKEGKADGLIIKKIKSKEPKEKVIKFMKRGLRKKYPANMIFSYRYTSCGETDDFDLCESCGIIFNQGLLLSDQELDHWESISDKELKDCIDEPFHAYQLEKITYDYHDGHKYADRIKSLSTRIVNVFKEAWAKKTNTR